jgi:hypothetical protein
VNEVQALITAVAAFFREFGIPLALFVTFAYLLVHKRADRAAYLVPGYLYDDARSEAERVRVAYEARILDGHRDMDARIAESRRQRDEERARSIEADERLRETVEVLRELTRTISEARLEVARLAGINPPHD